MEDRCVRSVFIGELSTDFGQPFGLDLGSDANIWFTDEQFFTPESRRIGRIDRAGAVSTFPLGMRWLPEAIVAGPDGNLWFTETFAGFGFPASRVDRITPAGTDTSFVVPISSAVATGITPGQDGNLWFTESNQGNIGRITPAGTITVFPLSPPPDNRIEPAGIVAGADGNLWFTANVFNQVTLTTTAEIGRITPTGTVTFFPVNEIGFLFGFAAGPDGNLWFTEPTLNRVGRMNLSGLVTGEFSLPTPNSGPGAITPGPDGNLWLTEVQANRIAKLSPEGVFLDEVPVPTADAMLADIAVGPYGTLMFAERGAAKVGVIEIGLTDAEKFVQRLYVDTLDRLGGPEEIRPWADFTIRNGTEITARLIDQSPEARFRMVKSWYRHYLGRDAMDNAEVEPWVGLLLTGAREERVLSQILASDEFYARAQALQTSGSPDERFVESLYNLLLDRAGNSQEIAGWIQYLPSSGHAGVAQGILQAPEYRFDVIADDYRTLLRREPDLQGFSAWEASPLDLGAVRIAIESSLEFFYLV